MNKVRWKKLWVDESFHKKLKREAVNKDMSIGEYTKQLGRDPMSLEELWVKKDERKKKFDMRF